MVSYFNLQFPDYNSGETLCLSAIQNSSFVNCLFIALTPLSIGVSIFFYLVSKCFAFIKKAIILLHKIVLNKKSEVINVQGNIQEINSSFLPVVNRRENKSPLLRKYLH